MDAKTNRTAIESLKETRPLIPPTALTPVTGLCTRTIQNMCARGELKAVKAGRRWLVNRDAALAYFGLE